MAEAVTLWSPVIITVRIPPALASATAWMASGRGGSIMEIRPMKVYSRLVGKVQTGSARHVPVGEGEHPQPLAGEFLVHRQDLLPPLVREFHHALWK